MKHHFKRIIIAEKILIPLRYALRLGHVTVVDRARHFARDARRRAVKTLVIFLQKRVVDTRVMVKAVDMRGRNEFYEIVIARQIFGVKAEMVTLLALVAALKIARRSDVRLAPQNRLYRRVSQVSVLFGVLRAALVIEGFKREKIAVIRNGERFHAKLTRLLYERHNLALSVKK